MYLKQIFGAQKKPAVVNQMGGRDQKKGNEVRRKE